MKFLWILFLQNLKRDNFGYINKMCSEVVVGYIAHLLSLITLVTQAMVLSYKCTSKKFKFN